MWEHKIEKKYAGFWRHLETIQAQKIDTTTSVNIINVSSAACN